MQRILVIDDDVLSREYITACLQHRYEVVAAPSGEKGLVLAELLPPDLVICDINMPGMDGYQVLERMQRLMQQRELPFIFLTALDSRDSVRHGMQLGADDYLTKPSSFSDILRAVDTQFAKKLRREQRMQNAMEQLRANITTSLPHELRTAVHIIEGYAQMALEDQAESASLQAEMLRSIRDNAERLHLLAEKFLWYVRTQVGSHEHQPKSRTAQAHAVIDEAARLTTARLGREADLTTALEPSGALLHEAYLWAMIGEVVENACKFSSAGTPVRVVGGVEFDRYKIVVIDRGRGMTREQIEAVGGFMQFERRRYEQQGTGLGLVIAQRIAALAGGEMRIESAGAGGTSVTLTVPVALT